MEGFEQRSHMVPIFEEWACLNWRGKFVEAYLMLHEVSESKTDRVNLCEVGGVSLPLRVLM
mgnify:CR=1 FL=1